MFQDEEAGERRLITGGWTGLRNQAAVMRGGWEKWGQKRGPSGLL